MYKIFNTILENMTNIWDFIYGKMGDDRYIDHKKLIFNK